MAFSLCKCRIDRWTGRILGLGRSGKLMGGLGREKDIEKKSKKDLGRFTRRIISAGLKLTLKWTMKHIVFIFIIERKHMDTYYIMTDTRHHHHQ